MKLDLKTYVKAGLIVVAAIVAIATLTTHPIVTALIVVVGGVFWAIDSGKIQL